MNSVPDLDLLTMREAAELLKVSEGTVARWLKQGRLPGYRVGPRAVRVRREDVERLAEPVAPRSGSRVEIGDGSIRTSQRRTDADYERGLEALRELQQLGKRIAARRGGRPLSDSVELVRVEREHRSRQLYEPTRSQ